MRLLSIILYELSISANLGDSLPIDTRSLSARATDPLVKTFPFPEAIQELLVLPLSGDSEMEETVLAIGSTGSLFRTHDFGMHWKRVDDVKDILYGRRSFNDVNRVYLTSKNSNNSCIVSYDRGNSFSEMKLPESEGGSNYGLRDHHNLDWYIYNSLDCDDRWCKRNAFYTKDRGQSWTPMFENGECHFTYEGRGPSQYDGDKPPTDGTEEPGMEISSDLIYCENWDEKTFDTRYYYSTNFFAEPEPQSLDIKGLNWISTHGDFVMATLTENGHNNIAISRDGLHFHRAVYPPNVQREHSPFRGFRTLQSKGSLVVFDREDYKDEFGTVFHSGKYGYEFTKVLENVYSGRHRWGGVEYTPIESVEGVILANVVTNPEEARKEKELPVVKTLISHSDGAMWNPIKGPNDQPLHLRESLNNMFMWDPSASASSSATTAAGIYISTGNEGESLSDSNLEYSTYMTRDGGVNWFKISDTPMNYAIGDQGAIIVMVSAVDPVDHLKYSYDEGATWQTYRWGYEAAVWSLRTVPSGASRRFMMTLRPSSGMDAQTVTVDFFTEGLQFCEASDFETWTPEHPQLGTKCLLGREVEYSRKIRDRDCFIGAHTGSSNRPGQRKTVKNCQCTREDYECDYTHTRDPETNECKLIDGQKIPSQDDQCKHDAIYWKKITGYRKIAASTCEGGETIEVDERFACPGKEKEFEEGKWLGTPGLKPLPINKKVLVLKILLGIFIVVMIIAVLLVVVRFRREISELLQNVGRLSPSIAGFFGGLFSKHRVSLPEDGEESLHQMQNWWHAAKSYIPFVGRRAPEDNLGFYSRMGDDERDRVLEEESGYHDDSEDEHRSEEDLGRE